MNYYQHHIGDYAAATAHLSLIEDAIYSRLLRRYYLQEAPLPVDVAQTARLAGARTPDEIATVELILGEFFTLTDEGWRNKRADEEIAAYRDKSAKASSAGRASAMRRINGRSTDVEQTFNERATNQEPITNNQEEAKAKARARPAPVVLPDWLPVESWNDWNDYRNSRKGWTAKAKTLSLKTLARLWQDGHDPKQVIEQSIEMGWPGLFPVRSNRNNGPPRPTAAPVGKTMATLTALEDRKNELRRMAGNRDIDGAPAAYLPGAG